MVLYGATRSPGVESDISDIESMALNVCIIRVFPALPEITRRPSAEMDSQEQRLCYQGSLLLVLDNVRGPRQARPPGGIGAGRCNPQEQPVTYGIWVWRSRGTHDSRDREDREGTRVLEGTKIGWGICHRRSHCFIHILLQTKHRIHCTRH